MTTSSDFLFSRKENFLQQHQQLCPHFLSIYKSFRYFPPQKSITCTVAFFMLFSASSVAFSFCCQHRTLPLSVSLSLSLPDRAATPVCLWPACWCGERGTLAHRPRCINLEPFSQPTSPLLLRSLSLPCSSSDLSATQRHHPLSVQWIAPLRRLFFFFFFNAAFAASCPRTCKGVLEHQVAWGCGLTCVCERKQWVSGTGALAPECYSCAWFSAYIIICSTCGLWDHRIKYLNVPVKEPRLSQPHSDAARHQSLRRGAQSAFS